MLQNGEGLAVFSGHINPNKTFTLIDKFKRVIVVLLIHESTEVLLRQYIPILPAARA